MTSRLAFRIEKAEEVVRSRPLHLIVCKDAAEVGEAERFLGDRFGDPWHRRGAAAPGSPIRIRPWRPRSQRLPHV
jgi:hypothetical protein